MRAITHSTSRTAGQSKTGSLLTQSFGNVQGQPTSRISPGRLSKRSLRLMTAHLLLALCYVFHNLGRVSDRLPEEHTLILTQVELRGKLRLVAVVEPGRQTHGGGEQIDVGRDQARVDVVVRPLNIGIAKAGLLEPGRVGQLVDVRDVDEANRGLGASIAWPRPIARRRRSPATTGTSR